VLTITPAAAAVIREWLRACSGIARPTVYLGIASKTPAEVTQAIERGVSRKELEEIHRRTMHSETKYLYPLVYPSSHFMWLTTTVGGFRFAVSLFYPKHVRPAVKNGVLDSANGGLVLKDGNGTVVLPKSAPGAL
jgi:hypothetical protein